MNKEIEGFKKELKKSAGDNEMIVTLNDRLETTIKENEKLCEQLGEIGEILE